MANIQTINIGNLVNDGTGDDLRTAFEKVNSNFTDLNAELTITGLNVGSVGGAVFKQKAGSTLEFRNINSGRNIAVTEGEDTLIISSTAPDAFVRIDTNSGIVQASAYANITLQGGDDIDINAVGGVITVDNVIPVTKILTTYDFGPISGDYTDTMQLVLQASNIDFGTLTYESDLVVDAGSLS
jgi:hypothetical protein